MYVTELDRPWLDSPFLFQGFSIESPDQLAASAGVLRIRVRGRGPRAWESPQGRTGGGGDLTIPGVKETPARTRLPPGGKRVLEYRQKLNPHLQRVMADARLGNSWTPGRPGSWSSSWWSWWP